MMDVGFGASLVMTGDKELLEKFDRLKAAVQDQISERVLQAGIDYLVQAGRDAVPAAKTPGHTNAAIRNSIRGRLFRISGGLLRAKVGFNVSRISAPHAHLYVLGTVARYVKGSQKKIKGRLTTPKTAYRGVMPANDFFAQAMSAAEGEAFDIMRQAFFYEMGKAE